MSCPGTGPTSGRLSSVAPKMPDQRCSTRGSSPRSSVANAVSCCWIGSVIDSSFVNSVSRLVSRRPPRIEAVVGRLLPVIEAVARVVRPRVERFRERLRREHLAPHWTDRRVELRKQAARVPVGRDHDVVGVELVQRFDAAVLDDLRPGLGRARRETPHPAGRLKRPVARVDDRAAEERREPTRQVLEPLRVEPVLVQGFVLGADRRELLVVGQPKAPDAPERIARERLQPVEGALGEAPELPRAVRAEAFPGLRVRHRPSAQREAAVPPARAGSDLPRLVHAHPQAALRQRERAGAAGHARADDDHVRAPIAHRAQNRIRGLAEPVRVGH